MNPKLKLVLAACAVLVIATAAAACSSDDSPGEGGAGPGGAGGQNACGDGVTDPLLGETCDPPETCQPICCSPACGMGDMCTAFKVVGSPSFCNLRCEREQITTCDADGCCVESCPNDPDCVCDGAADCNTCFQCAVEGACAGAQAACEAEPACVDYTNCVNVCADAACVQTCQAASPDGVAPYEAWFSCALCDECPVSCAGFQTPAFPSCP